MPDELKTFDVEDEESGETIKTTALSAYEALQKQLEEKDVLIKAQTEKMERDIPKGESFRALDKKVQKTEEEKTELVSRLEAIEKERDADKTNRIESILKKKQNFIANRANGDKELQDKIEFFYGRFAGDAITEEEIAQRVEEATFLAKRKPDNSTAFNRAASASGSSFVPEPKSQSFADTEEGVATAEAFGLSFTKAKKK